MSLLLDARKKSQQAQSAQGGAGSGLELSLEDYPGAATPNAQPVEHARSAGQNLFNAKTSAPSFARASINRNLLFALGGTILLLMAGAGYVWYSISAGSNNQPLRQAPPAALIAPPASATAQPQNKLVPEIAPLPVAEAKPAAGKLARARPAAKTPQARRKQAVLVERHQDEPIDPLLNSAYQAYRSGKFEPAQQLYHQVLKLDERNADALLGLAVIAQRRGEDSVAAHYYSQVLALDPRNAVANAGMSALTTGDNRESRLKHLLNEQQNSSSLHFALGNQYAEQSRWAEAQQAYFNAYKLDTGNAELAFNLAISLDHLGQKKLAAQYYQRALQLDSGDIAGFDHAQISKHIEELTH